MASIFCKCSLFVQLNHIATILMPPVSSIVREKPECELVGQILVEDQIKKMLDSRHMCENLCCSFLYVIMLLQKSGCGTRAVIP